MTFMININKIKINTVQCRDSAIIINFDTDIHIDSSTSYTNVALATYIRNAIAQDGI